MPAGNVHIQPRVRFVNRASVSSLARSLRQSQEMLGSKTGGKRPVVSRRKRCVAPSLENPDLDAPDLDSPDLDAGQPGG
eukprot:4626088-Pleurochrysis_carterae.AAC.1